MADIQTRKPLAMEYAAILRKRYEGKRLFTDDNMGLEWYQ
jgi:hypothetical protein